MKQGMWGTMFQYTLQFIYGVILLLFNFQSAICPVSNIIEEKGLVALAATVKALVSFKPKTSAV